MAVLRFAFLTLVALSGRVSAADDSTTAPPAPSMADAMADPAMMQNAMKMLQNPMVMQQMKVMMQDPNVKARMRRMLQRLGEDSGLEGADKLASDEEALDSIFERMQDPAVLERLQSLATSESFQKKVQTMTQNPQFMAAAGSYAEEMKEEVMAEAQAAGAAGVGGDDLDDLGVDDEELEEEDAADMDDDE